MLPWPTARAAEAVSTGREMSAPHHFVLRARPTRVEGTRAQQSNKEYQTAGGPGKGGKSVSSSEDSKERCSFRSSFAVKGRGH